MPRCVAKRARESLLLQNPAVQPQTCSAQTLTNVSPWVLFFTWSVSSLVMERNDKRINHNKTSQFPTANQWAPKWKPPLQPLSGKCSRRWMTFISKIENWGSPHGSQETQNQRVYERKCQGATRYTSLSLLQRRSLYFCNDQHSYFFLTTPLISLLCGWMQNTQFKYKMENNNNY